MTTALSAYPAPVEALMPQARTFADSLGEIPSRNALMKEFKIGAPKANAVREALTAERAEADEMPPPRVLHVVPDLEPDTDPGESAAPVDAEPVTDPVEAAPLATVDGHPDTNIRPVEVITTRAVPAARPKVKRKPVAWPVLLLALPAFVAIWSGWVELGELAGFGVVHPLPGIADGIKLNTAITLPIGVETYAAYALWVWLSGSVTGTARRFAKWSAIGSLVFGAAGQVAYHLMSAAGMTAAPWWITTAVACLPVAVLGMGAALAHLLHAGHAEA